MNAYKEIAKNHLKGKWVQIRNTGDKVKILNADYNNSTLEVVLRGSASVVKFSDVEKIPVVQKYTIQNFKEMCSNKESQSHWLSKLNENGRLSWLYRKSKHLLTDAEWDAIEEQWKKGFDQTYKQLKSLIIMILESK